MPVRPFGILWDTSVYLGIRVKSTFPVPETTFSTPETSFATAMQVRPALVAAEYSSRRGLELEYSRAVPPVCVNIHALSARGSMTARPPGGVPRVAHRGYTPPAAASPKSAPAGSETDRGATQEGYVPYRSVARSVERAPVVVPSSRPCRNGADDGGHEPEHEEDEQVRHRASVCGHTIPDARHLHRRVRDER